MIFTICLVGFIPNLSWQVIILSAAFSLLGAFIYIFNKATDMQEDAINLAGLPIEKKHYRQVIIAALICLVVPIPFLFQWPTLLILYIGLGGIGYFYSKPLKFWSYRRRLKDVFFVKNAVSAASWGAVPALVPALYQGQELGIETFLIWLNTFFFVFAIEVVWDIRDIEGDKAAGVKTIPNVYGVWPAKIFCLVPILAFFVFRLMSVSIHPIYLGAYVLTILSILIVRQNSHPYFFQSLVMIWIIANSAYLILYYN